MTHRWSERLVMLCGMLSLICLAGAPPDDAAQLLDRRLAALDAKAAKIVDLTADFRQEKFTALLKKPLVSSGRVRSKGSVVRWDTVQPGPVVLYADAKSLRLYYPKQQSEEVYPVDRRLGDLLASPLPRLAALREHFSLAAASEAQVAALSPFAKPEEKSAALFVTLTPTDDLLKQNVQNVVVALDVETGLVRAVETMDGDGDRTVIVFSNHRPDTGLTDADLDLKTAPGTKVVYPLQGTAEAATRPQ